jgi:hypothetical protein
LFDEEISPSSAYRRVVNYFESIDDATADRDHVLTFKWLFNLDAKYFKNRADEETLSVALDLFKT